MRREDRCEVRIIDAEKVKKISETLISGLEATQLADVFDALSDPTRLRIVSAIAAAGEVCVCDIAGSLGMTQSAISHQLRLLRTTGVLKNRKQGRMVFYTLASEHIGKIYEAAVAHVRQQ
ncbi:MAG: metalloregulator ArsR/SmtB family transcription factor [Anaerolineales bacterium]